MFPDPVARSGKTLGFGLPRRSLIVTQDIHNRVHALSHTTDPLQGNQTMENIA